MRSIHYRLRQLLHALPLRLCHPTLLTPGDRRWLVIAALLGLGWIGLAIVVAQERPFAIDTTILLWIHQFATPWLDQVVLGVTHLGNPSVMVPLGCIGLSLCLWQRRWHTAAIFALNCGGGVVMSYGLKLVFGKPRPQLWPQLITETSYSFPSGHAIGSMVLYGFSAYLLAQRFPQQRWFIYGLAGALIAGIGGSRLYLGVHWPTDVIGGYILGFLWVRLCIGLRHGTATSDLGSR